MRARAFAAALWLVFLSVTFQIHAVTTSYHQASSSLNPSTLENATDSSSGDFDILATGNEIFRKEIAKTNPGLLKDLTVNGQRRLLSHYRLSSTC